jgi:hypothetical protein
MPGVEFVLRQAAETKGNDTPWIKEGLAGLKTFTEEAASKESGAFWEELGGKLEVIRDALGTLGHLEW